MTHLPTVVDFVNAKAVSGIQGLFSYYKQDFWVESYLAGSLIEIH